MWSPSNLFCVQSKVHRLGEGEHKGTSIKIPGLTLRVSHENHRRGHWQVWPLGCQEVRRPAPRAVMDPCRRESPL